jgi:hypothetical protein
MKHQRSLRCLALALLTAALATTALAQGMTLIEARNDSTADHTGTTIYGGETLFRSAVSVNTPTLVANVASIDLRLSWLAGNQPHFGPSTTPLPTTNLGWSLVLRIEDPLEQGYSLDVGARLRGALGAQSDGLVLVVGNEVAGLRFGVWEAFASAPIELDGAALRGGRFEGLPPTNDPERVVIDQSGAAEVGRFRGTRSFLFYLEPAALQLDAVTYDTAYAWQQFGQLAPTLEWSFANPGPGSDASDLGQFFRVSATFNAAPVPEPGSLALLAAGGVLLLLRQRARQHTHEGEPS